MKDTRGDWDAIVVGLGAIGSAAAYWLSRSLGTGVLGLERFEMDHANGASADHSRIIRLSLPPARLRAPRQSRLRDLAAVEAEAGERIVTTTGGLDLWPADPAIPKADYTDSLTAENVPFDLLDAAEIRHRWPPAGCRFNPRCPVAFDRCRVEEPPLFDLGGGQSAACWLVEPDSETTVPRVSEVPA